MTEKRSGWQSLGEWSIGFALLALSVVGMMSIGILVLPVAAWALSVAARRNRVWPEAPLGALVGIGSLALFISLQHHGYVPCPESRTIILRLGASASGSCGGLDPAPWRKVGATLILSGLLAYSLFKALRPGKSH